MEETELYIKETIEHIAHQWRQPLSQINSTVGVIDKILYEKNIEEPLIEEKLKEIEALTKYMSQTIDTFSNNFIHGVQKESIKLSLIVGEALLSVSSSFKENNITLKTDINVDYEYKCAKEQIKEIIIILLNNAKDALLDRNTFNAEIDVSIRYENSKYLIKVADNAGGITKSVMKKIFEPYYTTKHHSKGTGIGLYMARKIIEERHCGSLDVQNMNRGTEFLISLSEEQDCE